MDMSRLPCEAGYGGNTAADLSFTATMTAPAVAGTYSYTVWTNQGSTSAGNVGSVVYDITVGAAPTTVPPITGGNHDGDDDQDGGDADQGQGHQNDRGNRGHNGHHGWFDTFMNWFS